MDRSQKEALVTELHQDFETMKGCILADYHGVNVEKVSMIRREMG